MKSVFIVYSVIKNRMTFEDVKTFPVRVGRFYPNHTRLRSVMIKYALVVLCLSAANLGVSSAAAQTVSPLSARAQVVVTHASAGSVLASAAQPASGRQHGRANFDKEEVSESSREMADWVVHSGDNRSKPFVIVDKKQAKAFVFDALGQLRGAAPVLLGLAIGDDSVPGIGQRKLSSIRPEERTTPAGRFVASLDRNLQGDEILWVDYDAAVSMHRVVTSNPKERRAQRLDSPVLADRRISYGCINVPVHFFNKVLSPAFTGTDGIVYVLPEIRSIREVFGSYVSSDLAVAQSEEQAAPVALAPQNAR